MAEFQAPERSLAGLNAETTALLISAAADVALMVDGKGVIRDISLGSDELAAEGYGKWVGRSWTEIVTVESRPKVVELLSDAGGKKPARRWRHLDHPSSRGADVPVLYSAVRVGNEGNVIAIGRDLRAVASLQQQLVDAQQSMERDYLRLRHLETRYRLLFQMGSEGVLIVDAGTHKVLEANPAAARIMGVKKIVGRALAECFTTRTRGQVSAMLGRVPEAGRSEEVEARLAGGQHTLTVSASLFRQDSSALFLVRLTLPSASTAERAGNAERSMLLQALESVPDGFVVTDVEGRILSTNAAFVEMTQLTSPEQLRGQSLDRWLGRSGVDLSVLIANLRQQGSVRLFATQLHGQHGGSTQVEISAAHVPHDEHPCLGFTIRDVGRRLTRGPEVSGELPRSASDLTKLVGRVPLKDIVGETTDLIEKMCIAAALDLTRDNRASAAEMLGLSRQSLYVKLRRYDMGDFAEG